MGKKVRSAKGEIIDFDLFHIKNQMAKKPKTVDVKARQDFIERKLRRRVAKKVVPVSTDPVEVEAKVSAESSEQKELIPNEEQQPKTRKTIKKKVNTNEDNPPSP